MLLRVEDLHTHFVTPAGWVPAVNGVSFEIDHGKTVGIVGESGCGKSATALSLIRLLPTPPAKIVGGKILFLNRDLLRLSVDEMRKIRGKEIAMIFQEPMTALNPLIKVGHQIAEVMNAHEAGLEKEGVLKRVESLLEKVGIPEAVRSFHSYPHELSGGMRQRIIIAMALACGPKLLIADEPTTALDVTIQAQILDLVRTLQAELGMAVLLITHDLGVVAEMASELLVMYAGKIVEKAPMRELLTHPMHPYTRGLLESMPSFRTSKEGPRSRLHAIGGNVPDLLNLPSGCSFQARCNLVKEGCRLIEPRLECKRQSHWVSCFEA